jgi:hypothetical protein
MRCHVGYGDFDPEHGVTSDVCPRRHMSEEQRSCGTKDPHPLRGTPILEENGVARRLRTAEGMPHFSLLVLFSNPAFRRDASF